MKILYATISLMVSFSSAQAVVALSHEEANIALYAIHSVRFTSVCVVSLDRTFYQRAQPAIDENGKAYVDIIVECDGTTVFEKQVLLKSYSPLGAMSVFTPTFRKLQMKLVGPIRQPGNNSEFNNSLVFAK